MWRKWIAASLLFRSVVLILALLAIGYVLWRDGVIG
jgi:hypothetical protein